MNNLNWTSEQKHVAVASILGWTLDAFDFFLMVFVLKNIAAEFHTQMSSLALAITLTLALRPVGAFIFGRFAERYGRRPILIINILCFAFLEFLTAFSPNLLIFIILRALFGIAMGGEWGVGSALVMESIPVKARGFISGLLQSGYPMGYLLASLVFVILFPIIGWRGMFIVGGLPALLVLYIRWFIPESPAWNKTKAPHRKTKAFLLLFSENWKLALYAILLMTALNFFSHGSQDLYPTFLQLQHGFDTHTVGIIAVIYNIGAIIGGFSFGFASEYLGRRKTMLIAAILSLLILPLWAFSTTVFTLALGAFLMQIAVQGAWGVIPAYLNELSPGKIRATFPGFVYQLGNLFASANASIQVWIATLFAGKYSYALAIIVGTVAIFIILFASFGPEKKGVNMIEPTPGAEATS